MIGDRCRHRGHRFRLCARRHRDAVPAHCRQAGAKVAAGQAHVLRIAGQVAAEDLLLDLRGSVRQQDEPDAGGVQRHAAAHAVQHAAGAAPHSTSFRAIRSAVVFGSAARALSDVSDSDWFAGWKHASIRNARSRTGSPRAAGARGCAVRRPPYRTSIVPINETTAGQPTVV
jgi:hypothetical protein